MLLTEQAQFDIYVRENWRMVFAKTFFYNSYQVFIRFIYLSISLSIFLNTWMAILHRVLKMRERGRERERREIEIDIIYDWCFLLFL